MTIETLKPLILGITADLLLIAKIEPIIERSGCRVLWIDRCEDLIKPVNASDIHLASRLEAREKDALIDGITALLPELIILDINQPNSIWQVCLPLLKTDPATRRIPVVVYGPHIQAEKLAQAKDLGADIALPRSKIIKQLPLLIKEHATIPDPKALFGSCKAPLSEGALAGIEQFNQKEYFLAHENLEQAWIEDDSEIRDLYRTLVQTAVVCYQIERGNYIGARKMFLRLRQRLVWLPDECRGINIEKLRMDIDRIQTTFLALGPKRLRDFDRKELPKISYRPY